MSPEQIEIVIRSALSSAAPQYILLAVVLSGIAALVAAYVGSYLQTKGTHRAIREDLKTLTEKVAATTKAAEEIKARIGQSTWVEQRRWELKRDLYTDLLKSIYRALNVTSTVFDLYIAEDGIEPGEWKEKVKKRRGKLESELQPLWDEIARVRGIGELLFSAETIAALDKFHAARTQAFEAYFEELDATSGAAKTAHTELVAFAKKDLEL